MPLLLRRCLPGGPCLSPTAPPPDARRCSLGGSCLPGVERPKGLDDGEAIAAWSAAAKEAMGAPDGRNPNGGGALQRRLEAEDRAGGKARAEQMRWVRKQVVAAKGGSNR